MNVFELRNQLVNDYKSYVSSFIQIRDNRIREYVDDQLNRGLLWPEPLIQLNPAFQPGSSVDDLVDTGVLHKTCKSIFRRKKTDDTAGSKLRLHQHQEDAIRVAQPGANYVLTTGTGSGKSLAYIIPIVDFLLRHGSGKAVQAIIVYPMNALANSQLGELEKFVNLGFPDNKGQVTFGRYTGQESDEEKKQIMANPPDILLTNYVMLELILTRPDEPKTLVNAAQGLRFLVLDELHTYRGRQGADVAMLVRRVRNTLNATNLQCIGTSATLSSAGGFDEQRKDVAAVATKLFGDMVLPANVIGETLRRSTVEMDFSDPSQLEKLKDRISLPETKLSTNSDLIKDPLASWIESNLGLKTDDTGRLVRAMPRKMLGKDGIAPILSKLTGISEAACASAIAQTLLLGYNITNTDTGMSSFAFRLHQFFNRGNTVYTSIESEDERYITIQGQKYVPGDRSRVLLPLVFCRECGQEYYVVRKTTDQDTKELLFISGLHMNFFFVKQTPVLPPSAYTPADIDFIASRLLELVYTANDLRPFAEDMGYHGEPFRWDEVRRAQIRAELDAYYTRLYGLTRDELRYILDPKEVHGEDFPGETFRVLKEKEVRLYGEYRTRRLVLEAWDNIVG